MNHKMGSTLGAIVSFLHIARAGAEIDETLAGIGEASDNAKIVLAGARRWIEATGIPIVLETVEPTSPIVRAVPPGCRDRLILGPIPKVRAHPEALTWQWREILDNAIRQAPTGRIHVHGTTTEDGVEIVAADTGPGWTEEQAERAFLPFVTLPGRSGGAGMGLPIVRALAAKQGGTAFARESVGGGAEVVVRYQAG